MLFLVTGATSTRGSPLQPNLHTFRIAIEHRHPDAFLQGREVERERIPGRLGLFHQRSRRSVRGFLRDRVAAGGSRADGSNGGAILGLEGPSFFFTEAGATDLIVRSRNPFDNATPSGNSIAPLAMMRLGALTGDESLWDIGVRTVGSFAGLLERSPTSFAQMGCALDFSLQTPLEIAVVGEGEGPRSLAAAVHEYFLPNKVVCGWPSRAGDEADPEEAERLVPLLAGKCANSLQAAYVCEEMVCSPPIEAPQTLAQRLAEAIPGHLPQAEVAKARSPAPDYYDFG